ncbi:hypothetical protein EDD21DRAFT_413252 [Dissophora ornata]|nr:hypothetical protein EDD21DRAFT_413252 [Dissophora ornata]
MLSLIRPSSSPCLHQHPDSLASPASASSGAVTAPAAASSTSSAPLRINTRIAIASLSPKSSGTAASSPSLSTAASPAIATSRASAPTTARPSLKSSATAPLNSGASYKELVAQFTAKAPQPYGVIPPRRKRAVGLPRSVSTSSITTAATKKTSPPPLSPIETSRNSVELRPTSLSANGSTNNGDSNSGNPVQTRLIEPLFRSFQSLLPESTSSSTRLGFWANLKAHYLAANTTNLSWGGSNSSECSASKASGGVEEFSPPIALRLSNSTPVAAVDATEAILSLPNIAAPSADPYRGTVNFPVSVAAMDKFKVIRSDTIPLKTFTYQETPVVERPQPLPLPRSTLFILSKRDSSKSAVTLSPPKSTKNANENTAKDAPLLPALPRHLATREMRSNTDYLRMMASELRMIRSRKLISPLKPRGFLPRRKDPFRRAKSSLCNCIELPREEDNHPLNDLMVGSWSSVSSTDSFLSATSSEYQSASESFF